MEQLKLELARVTQERRRLQRQASSRMCRSVARREHAVLVATVAFCHVPSAGETIAVAMQHRFKHILWEDVVSCTREIEDRFLQTSVDELGQWLEWQGALTRKTITEAKRLVEDTRLHVWISNQNCAQGVAPPPQFVWEKRCALVIENHDTFSKTGAERHSRSDAAKKWVQRFRQRWDLVLGRQEAKDVLPVGIMRSKVMIQSHQKDIVCYKHFSFRGPNVDPILGSV
jgi:hypothetical protein